MQFKTILIAIETELQKTFNDNNLKVHDLEPYQGLNNRNNESVGDDFIQSKYKQEDNAFLGMHPVVVLYSSQGESKSLPMIIKGHEPGAFTSNICEPTYKKYQLTPPGGFEKCFSFNEFEWLFEGEYHYYHQQLGHEQAWPVLPAYYGRYYDEPTQYNYIFIELIPDMEHLNEWLEANNWDKVLYDATFDGLARVHASFLGQEHTMKKRWLTGPFTASEVERDKPIWSGLFEQLKKNHPEEIGDEISQCFYDTLNSIATWHSAAEAHPHTIIHGDFNPRNTGYKKHDEQWRLVAHDWECIRWGLPQYDFAQFLLHSCNKDTLMERYHQHNDQMRQLLCEYSGQTISSDLWNKGFKAAVAMHLLNRGPMIGVVCDDYMPSVANFGLHMLINAAHWLKSTSM